MEKPSNLLLKLSKKLFEAKAQQTEFIEALLSPKSFHPCILWRSPRPKPYPFQAIAPLDWQPAFVDRLALKEKPGRHYLHQKGAFYCLDFSSVFAISPLLTIPNPVDLVIDVCAAPGGKSVFAWVALQPNLLLSNEVVSKRVGQLVTNLKRCQIERAIALRLDAEALAAALTKTAQVVLVDAPCSGQSLLAKGEKALGCFHPTTINGNANRQKRILANSAQLVAPQGYLAYTTCTYSLEENEQVIEWFVERFPQFQPVEILPLVDFQSQLTHFYCYRMFPQMGLGAGAFTTLLQNTEVGAANTLPKEFINHPGAIVL